MMRDGKQGATPGGFVAVDVGARGNRSSSKKSNKKRPGTKALIVVAVLVLVLVVLLCVAAYFVMQRQSGLELYYASDVKVKVTADSRITPFDGWLQKLAQH